MILQVTLRFRVGPVATDDRHRLLNRGRGGVHTRLGSGGIIAEQARWSKKILRRGRSLRGILIASVCSVRAQIFANESVARSAHDDVLKNFRRD
jgi:hypothetical protein